MPRRVKQRKQESATVSFCDPVQSSGFSKHTMNDIVSMIKGEKKHKLVKKMPGNEKVILYMFLTIHPSTICSLGGGGNGCGDRWKNPEYP